MDVIDEFNPEEWKIATGNEVEGIEIGRSEEGPYGWQGGVLWVNGMDGGVPSGCDEGFLLGKGGSHETIG